MTNDKILWNTSTFKWIRILLCIVPLFVPSWSNIPYDEVKFQIFDRKVRQFEMEIYKSLQTTKNFFASAYAGNVIMGGLLASNVVPILGPFAGTAYVVRTYFAQESDWKEAFERAIAHETRSAIALFQVQLMDSTMQTIQGKLKRMKNNTDMDSLIRSASSIHTQIDIMLNSFAQIDSLFKKYPLIGTPPLIALAQLIAFFDPIAKALIPSEAEDPELSCKMRDILLDYRPRTVNARLEKLHFRAETPLFHDSVSQVFPQILFNATLIKYNENGYNQTSPGTLNCRKDSVHANRSIAAIILHDDFGVDDYYHDYLSCATDYALLVRHRVEDIFPVELLNRLCVNPRQTTGFGWLTIKLKELRAVTKWDGYKCDFAVYNPCDPFVQLFIDGEMLFDTPVRLDNCCYNVDMTYTSNKISKRSWIKIEVRDADYGSPDLVLRTEGDVDSFLRRGHRSVELKYNKLKSNFIQTISFWQDEYEDS